jgi:Xaa-Pro aminopeptidase
VLVKARFERFIAHRTGHSIGYDIHGAGTNLDSWETNDTREILPMSSFSIEPGLYLPGEFGVRLETTVAIDGRGKPRVVGELQEAPVQI